MRTCVRTYLTDTRRSQRYSCYNGGLLGLCAFKLLADTTRDVTTATSNTGKYPPTYGDLFPYVIERGGTSPDGVEMESSGPWPVTNIYTPAGDEATAL